MNSSILKGRKLSDYFKIIYTVGGLGIISGSSCKYNVIVIILLISEIILLYRIQDDGKKMLSASETFINYWLLCFKACDWAVSSNTVIQ